MSSDSHEDAYAPAPGALELIRSFVNTADLDEGTEELGDPRALADWLAHNGFEVRGSLGPTDLRRAIEFREHIRALLLTNNGGSLQRSDVAAIERASQAAAMQFRVDESGRIALEPERTGVDALVGTVLATVLEAQSDGTWSRLKACPGEDCAWAFYDQSRNGSRTWCSMAVCGNRVKTRRYRQARAGRP